MIVEWLDRLFFEGSFCGAESFDFNCFSVYVSAQQGLLALLW
jgi:hypothetical protein